MPSVIVEVAGNITRTSSTSHFTALVSGNANYVPTESSRTNPIRTAGVFSNLYVRISGSTTTSSSTVLIRKNTANGNSTVTIGAAATGEFEDNTNTDTVASGDQLSFSVVVGTGTSLLVNVISAVFTANVNTVQILGASNGTTLTTDSNTNFFSLCGAKSANGSTESLCQANCQTNGTLKNLFLNVPSNTRTTTTTFRTRINGVNGNLTVSVGSGATGIFEDTSNSDTVVAGDLLNWTFTTSTGGNTLNVGNLGLSMETTNNQFMVAGGLNAAIAAATTVYAPLTGQSPGTAAELDVRSEINMAATASQLWAMITANATTSNSTVRFRINGVNGNQLLTIGAAATGEFIDSSNSDTLVASDEPTIQVVTGATSTLTLTAVSLIYTTSNRLIKLINGLAIASSKTLDGLALASVKKRENLAAN